MTRRWRLYRAAEPQRGPATAALLTGIFVALVLVTRLFCTDQIGNASFWPANGALVVALLVLPPRLGALTCLVCLAANLLLNRANGVGPYDNCLYTALNGSVSLLTAFLTRSLCGAATDLSRARRLLVFTAIALVSAAAEAAIGDLLDPLSTQNGLLPNWFQWSLCDGLGLVLGTPAILFAVTGRQGQLGGEAGPLERWLLLGGTTLLCLLAFAWARSPLILMVYPALILTAFRAGPVWVLTTVLLVSIVASAMTLHGDGPLALLSAYGADMRENMMQPYLISLFLAAMPANNALGDMARAAHRLGRLKAAREHDASHDPLTTLANRDLFRRRLSAMLTAGTLRAVLFIDLDRFKHVNDTLGHQAGDELLRAFSARLAASVPHDAMVARFGGDEFAVLLAHSSHPAEISSLCEAIKAAASAPFGLPAGQAHVSASLGVALHGDEVQEAGELMRKADIALYAAKAAGRNCSRVFCEALDRQVREKAELEADLRAALQTAAEHKESGHKESGLHLHYQVKFDAQGAARGVEALVRWLHPVHGPIAPPRFISVAEETGLILPLGAWVFREAVAFAARWPWLEVAVNVSPIQLRHPDLAATMLRTLRAADIAAGRMEIEVTETVLLDEVCPATQCLHKLREAGLRVAIDDFGTGYSSMRQLQRFKVDRLKIDQSFVAGLGRGKEPAAIVQAIITLGHAMGLKVTAEGIETWDQHDFLVDAGVDELQGYLLARPVAEDKLAKALIKSRQEKAAYCEPA